MSNQVLAGGIRLYIEGIPRGTPLKLRTNVLVMVVWMGCAVALIAQSAGGNAPAPMTPPATGTGAGQQGSANPGGQRSGVSGVSGARGVTGGNVPANRNWNASGARGGGVRSDANTRIVRDGRGSTETPGVSAGSAVGAMGAGRSGGTRRNSRTAVRSGRVSGAKRTVKRDERTGGTDAAGQASPTRAVASAPVTDSAAEASPTSGEAHAVTIPAGTKLRVRLESGVTSASAKNGDLLRGTLVSAVRSSAGVLGAGTVVTLTVVEAARAGTMESAGEFSLQAIQVGGVKVASLVVVRKGVEGAKELADSAPAKGTEAVLAAGDVVEFAVPDVRVQ